MLLTHTSTSKPVAFRSVYHTPERFETPFHWLEAGWENDETIVLLHGLLAHSMAYRKALPWLARDYRLIVPDLPAHGRDETYQSEMIEPRVDSLVDWLSELLEAVDAERVHLVGHSIGALAGFLAARSEQGLAGVDTLSLVSPGIRIGVPAWIHHLFGLMPFGLARLGATALGVRIYEPIQWRKSRMTSLEVDAYVKPFREPDRLRFMIDMGVDLVRHPDRLKGAHNIDQPTLIVWGAHDHLLPVQTGRLLEAMIPNAHLEVLEGTGHCPMEDAPNEFACLVRDFLTNRLGEQSA